MFMIPFYIVDPDLAARETRTITLLKPNGPIPTGSYALVEVYCPDPDCDCRRVILNVVEERHPARILATIGYGFDRDGPDPGPYLDPLNPQSSYADELLWLVDDVVLHDAWYLARLERHYALTKQAAKDPRHPAYAELQSAIEPDLVEALASLAPYQQQEKPIGRNDPCPCGSGKKYKHCCGQR